MKILLGISGALTLLSVCLGTQRLISPPTVWEKLLKEEGRKFLGDGKKWEQLAVKYEENGNIEKISNFTLNSTENKPRQLRQKCVKILMSRPEKEAEEDAKN